jgi:hypothetical protein
MWVIYNTETGEEYDRIDGDGIVAARQFLKGLNDNEFGTVYAMRWED